jgi:hypothetical protein
LYIYLTNRYFNIYIVKCFGNSVEAILYLAAFHFYLKITKLCDKNMMAFTFIITAAFMVRCTSPIGFALLVIIKIFKEKCFISFLVSGVAIAIPTLTLCVAMDSYYYESFTFVPYNFLKKNILESISE